VLSSFFICINWFITLNSSTFSVEAVGILLLELLSFSIASSLIVEELLLSAFATTGSFICEYK